MVLKLYGAPLPIGTTLAVLMTLVEKQIPFEMVTVDLQNDAHKAPEYLAVQPFGQVPAIDDDGFIIYESRAICRYLAEKYAHQGTPLIPTELQAKARFEQAASIEFANFQPFAWALYVEGIRKARKGLQKDQAAWDVAEQQLSAKLDIYEAILGSQQFLAGDEFTLADLFHVSFGDLLAPAGCDLLTSKGPNVARWWNAIRSRASYTRFQGAVEISNIEAY
ncbi:glutathione S-transferase [Mycena belliarum]|uniref:glutathione transferase n=1 Tax=Mycena belliarum TaxID=1033014 RepID=A0AAD6UFA1_9AGAR|nr:glutathione S-transferase [Mycena belliae]